MCRRSSSGRVSADIELFRLNVRNVFHVEGVEDILVEPVLELFDDGPFFGEGFGVGRGPVQQLVPPAGVGDDVMGLALPGGQPGPVRTISSIL